MMAEKGDELSICSENKERHAGEAVGHTLPEMKHIVSWMPVEEKEGELHLKATVIAKEEGATVSPKAQEEMVEGGPTTSKGSPKWVLRKNAPFDKSTYFSSAGLIPEGGDATFTGGIISRESPVSAPRVAALTMGKVVANQYPVSCENPNADVKHELMKEIRRYGRKYGRIFKLLEEVQGPLEARKELVEFTIKEAARFKRHHLIHYLKEILEKLMSESSLKNDDLHPSV